MKNPEHVSIVALGPSATTFVRYADAAGGSKAYCDEVWGVNMNGGILQCDRVFHMDDLKIQEARIANGSHMSAKLEGMLAWMRETDVPIYTSRAYADYPSSVDFPLEEVLTSCGRAYFNNTVPYAIGLCIHLAKTESLKKLSLFGLDYTYPDIVAAETGRACCEFWLGRLMLMGVEVFMTTDTSLLDTCLPDSKKFYGYDTLDLDVTWSKEGKATVHRRDRLVPRNIDEIEREYDSTGNACRSKHQVNGGEALDRLLEYDDIKTVLDIGSGDGTHAKIMVEAGKKVTTVVYVGDPELELTPCCEYTEGEYEGDFNDLLIEVPPGSNGYDAIWASHVLEHQLDVGVFLRKCFRLLRDDGLLVITVPPAKHDLVGGHLTIWSTGLVIYNLIMAGFDCSEARVSGCYPSVTGSFPYNLSIIVRKQQAELPELVRDYGDIGKLQQFFPVPIAHGFDGNLPPAGW